MRRAISTNLLRSLLIAGLAVSVSIAPARSEEHDDEQTSGETERPVTLSAVFNQAFLFWNDGGQSDTYAVGSAPDTTSLALEGEFDYPGGWSLGFTAGLDILHKQSDLVNQIDADGEETTGELSDLFFTLTHEKLGTLLIGYADSASDGIDNNNFANADALAGADVMDWNGAFFLRAAGISGDAGLATGETGAFNDGFGELVWEDFIDGALAGDTRKIVSYTTPDLHGFAASAAVDDSQHYWDAALRYEADLAEQWRVAAGIGYWEDTAIDEDAGGRRDDTGWGGSFAVRHIPTGINLALGYGRLSHAKSCAEPGEVTGRCRGDDETLYVIGGIETDFTGWGTTSIYGEYYRGTKSWNLSDEDMLRTLEAVADEAEELSSSRVTVIGAGIVHNIKDTQVAIYLGYRHYQLDVDLIADGGPVAARDLDDFNVVMTGLRVKF